MILTDLTNLRADIVKIDAWRYTLWWNLAELHLRHGNSCWSVLKIIKRREASNRDLSGPPSPRTTLWRHDKSIAFTDLRPRHLQHVCLVSRLVRVLGKAPWDDIHQALWTALDRLSNLPAHATSPWYGIPSSILGEWLTKYSKVICHGVAIHEQAVAFDWSWPLGTSR